MSGNPTFHSCLEKVTRIWGPPELWGFHDGLIEPWECVWTFVKTDSCEGTISSRRTFSSSIILKNSFGKDLLGKHKLVGNTFSKKVSTAKKSFTFPNIMHLLAWRKMQLTKMWFGKFCKNTAWDLLQSFERLETHKAPLMQILSWICTTQEE